MKKLKYYLLVLVVFLILISYLLYSCKKENSHNININDNYSYEELLDKFENYEPKKGKKIDIPIYYINMDKYKDRRDFMENNLKKFSNKYERIKGFNGYLIENKQTDMVDGITFYNDYSNLTKSEIGCTLSHLMAIKRAYDNFDDISLILEDDTNISLIKTLDFEFSDFFKNAPEDWEILKLFHIGNSEKLKSVKKYKDYTYLLEEESYPTFSCVGYIINRKGMEKIVNYVYFQIENQAGFHIKKEKEKPLDGVADFFIYNLTKTYNITPNLFFPNNINLKSTIHDDHTSMHIKASYNVLKTHYEISNRKLKYQFLKKYYEEYDESYKSSNNLLLVECDQSRLSSKSNGLVNDSSIVCSILNDFKNKPYFHFEIYEDSSPDDWIFVNLDWTNFHKLFNDNRAPHTILCKTKQTYEILSKYIKDKDIKDYQLIYTGFTSIDRYDYLIEKDYNKFIHIPGKSSSKGTLVIVKTWLEHPEYPLLTIIARDNVASDIKLLIDNKNPNNILLLDHLLNDDILSFLSNNNGFHICTSEYEGFGHNVNEGLSLGAVTLYTNGECMNEKFIDGVSGIAVDCKLSEPVNKGFCPCYKITTFSIEKAVERVLGMSYEQLKKIGIAARDKFLKDDQEFKQNFRNLISSYNLS